ncbi:CDP-alcohol phosphatidyltransferase family protein [soil metagenome]
MCCYLTDIGTLTHYQISTFILSVIFVGMKLFTIPNIITLLNLLCGCFAIVFAFELNFVWSFYFVAIAAVLDFFDGFLARLLNQHSPIGKELDSLADMVTFGVVPGMVMFMMLVTDFHFHAVKNDFSHDSILLKYPLALIAFLIPLFSALRLAKFNIDTRQSDSFIGVPTPANAILLCSLGLLFKNVNYLSGLPNDGGKIIGGSFNVMLAQLLSNEWVLIGITIVMSVLLISEIPLFALKFKSFGWKGNEIRWSFLAVSVLLLVTLQFVGIPLAIVLYILMSVISNLAAKKGVRG